MKLNIRPFTDALRGTGHPWRKLGDNRLGGERLVTFGCLFRGAEPVVADYYAQAGDRWLTIQLWGASDHRVSHSFATQDCARNNDGSPSRSRAITRPTDFKTPAEMLIAIQVELLRGDHTPPPSAFDHGPLDQRTSMLVDRFAFALKEKLLDSQSKYGWTDHWAKDDWQDRCTQALCDHLAKGDPRDVAAFAAFMWHHGWSTRHTVEVPLAFYEWLAGIEKDVRVHDLTPHEQAGLVAALKDRDVVLEEAARAVATYCRNQNSAKKPSSFVDAVRAIRALKERV